MKLITLVCFSIVFSVNSLSQKGKNLPRFNRKKIHFGFALGGVSSDFQLSYDLKNNPDSIININYSKKPGLSIGVISSYNLTRNFSLRTVFPTFVFHERMFSYQYLKNNELITKENNLNSTTLNFQLLGKLKSNRINNFLAYGLFGFEYSIDLSDSRKYFY